MGNYIPTTDSPGSYEIISFFYYEEDNRFKDENGDVVSDIFRYITPNQLRLFKERNAEENCREPFYIEDNRKRVIYEFIYPVPDWWYDN